MENFLQNKTHGRRGEGENPALNQMIFREMIRLTMRGFPTGDDILSPPNHFILVPQTHRVNEPMHHRNNRMDGALSPH